MTKKVGYKSPPDHTKWTPGQSGNPKGRPKGSTNFKTDLAAELAELIQVTQNGKATRISKQRAVLKALIARAIKGDTRAAHIIIEWVARHLTPPGEPPSQTDLAQEDRDILEAYLTRQMAKRTNQSEDAE